MSSSKFTSQVLIYGLGLAVNYGIGFILLPVYTRLMPEATYGALDILNRNIELISVLLMTQYSIAYLRFFRESKEDDYRARVTSTFILIAGLVSGVVAIGLAVFGKHVSTAAWGHDGYSYYVGLSGLKYFTGMLFTIPFIYFQATEQPGKYVVISAVRVAAILATTIVLLVNLEDKLFAALISPIAVNIVFLFAVGLPVFLRTSRSFDFGIARDVFKFVWSFSIVGVYSFVMTNGDRYVINRACSPAEVGIYAAGYKVGMVLNSFAMSPILRAWHARMVDVMKKADGVITLSRLTTLSLLLYSTLGLTIAIYSREIVGLVMARGYFPAYRIIPIIVLAYAFSAAGMLMDTAIYYTRKTYLKLWHGITAASCIGLYLWLIPQYCMMGAAWATVGTYLVFVIVTWVISQRELKVPYEFAKLARVIIIAIAVYLANYSLENYETSHLLHLRLAGELAYPAIYLAIVLLLKSPLLLIFALLVWGARILEPDDKLRIRNFYNDVKARLPFLNRGPAITGIDPPESEMT
jgi:O-antigen/teichoic acid export membrane protein